MYRYPKAYHVQISARCQIYKETSPHCLLFCKPDRNCITRLKPFPPRPPLPRATVILWAGCLAISFGIWYYFERTLSIHSIYTRRREAFYWNVILFTFALGTGTGDMVAEEAGIGYW